MRGDDKAKVIFTTDRNSKDFLNNQVPGIVEHSEVVETIHDEIKNLNQSRRKCIMEHQETKRKPGKQARESKEELIKKYIFVMGMLFTGPKTITEIHQKMYSGKDDKTGGKDIQNLLQRMKHGSGKNINSIKPPKVQKGEPKLPWRWKMNTLGKGMTIEKMAEIIYENRNAVFQASIENRKTNPDKKKIHRGKNRGQKDDLLKPPIPPPDGKPLHQEIVIPYTNQPFNLTIIFGPLQLSIKMNG